MRFLLDANLSPVIADHLGAAGHVCRHVRDFELSGASDEQIMEFARLNDYVVVSQDSDFTNLLYYLRADRPSLILLRDVQEVSAAGIAGLVVANFEQIQTHLTKGAVVSMVRDRIRIRDLPIQ